MQAPTPDDGSTEGADTAGEADGRVKSDTGGGPGGSADREDESDSDGPDEDCHGSCTECVAVGGKCPECSPLTTGQISPHWEALGGLFQMHGANMYRIRYSEDFAEERNYTATPRNLVDRQGSHAKRRRR